MIATLGALAPVALVIALGWGLRRARFPGDAFWAPAERLTYYVLFPALLVNNLAGAPLAALPVAPMALAMASAILAGAAAMIVLKPRLGVDGPGFTSLFQGAIRLNSYAGIAAAAALYGQAGVTLAAVVLATFIPLVNLLCVGVLGRYAGATPAGWREAGRSIARNPLILACLGGAALNALGIGVPLGLGTVLDILGRAALAFGLLSVGAGLSFAGVRRAGVRHAGRGIAATCAVKLIGVPLVAALACALLGLEGVSAGVVILFAALPTASSSYILARLMGGDAPLMAQVVAATTVGAAITMPVALAVLG